ncbi:hypothetical protein Leryth_013373 [Lithospermum erythrorhizon]|nr:hypothetical protein Leryth_013373 [Lithospermum erythrorhizon]
MILGRLIRTNNKFASSSLPYYGPKTYPIIGCLYDYFKNRHNLLDWYTHLLQESPTQTILISRLGARRTIVTANPVNVEYILKTNFNYYPKSKPFTEILRDFLGNGIFNVDGELWSTQRKLVSHQFSAKALQDHVLNDLKEVMDEKLIPLLESLANTQQQKAVDLQDILRRMGFDIICKFSLGFDPDCLLDHHHSVSFLPVMEAFDIASKVS